MLRSACSVPVQIHSASQTGNRRLPCDQRGRAGDIVLIAGKGHEKVQITREGSIPFDDVEVARGILRDAGYDCEAANAAAGKTHEAATLSSRRIYFCSGSVRPRRSWRRGIPSTRARIQPGELFFAVKGERMDGHDFVDQALEKGAVAAVIRKDQLSSLSRPRRA